MNKKDKNVFILIGVLIYVVMVISIVSITISNFNRNVYDNINFMDNIFSIIGIMFFGFIVATLFMIKGSVYKKFPNNVILEKGVKYVAEFIGSKNLYVNNFQTVMFSVIYKFKTTNGVEKIHESSYIYTNDDVILLKQKGSFYIKYYKDQSVIIEDLNKNNNSLFDKLNNTEGQKYCDYCGSIIEPNEKKCTSCGAKRKK